MTIVLLSIFFPVNLHYLGFYVRIQNFGVHLILIKINNKYGLNN
jgi:hypothetical protein